MYSSIADIRYVLGLRLICRHNFENYRLLFLQALFCNNRMLTSTILELQEFHGHDTRIISINLNGQWCKMRMRDFQWHLRSSKHRFINSRQSMVRDEDELESDDFMQGHYCLQYKCLRQTMNNVRCIQPYSDLIG